jgi:hypothetical protein
MIHNPTTLPALRRTALRPAPALALVPGALQTGIFFIHAFLPARRLGFRRARRGSGQQAKPEQQGEQQYTAHGRFLV